MDGTFARENWLQWNRVFGGIAQAPALNRHGEKSKWMLKTEGCERTERGEARAKKAQDYWNRRIKLGEVNWGGVEEENEWRYWR